MAHLGFIGHLALVQLAPTGPLGSGGLLVLLVQLAPLLTGPTWAFPGGGRLGLLTRMAIGLLGGGGLRTAPSALGANSVLTGVSGPHWPPWGAYWAPWSLPPGAAWPFGSLGSLGRPAYCPPWAGLRALGRLGSLAPPGSGPYCTWRGWRTGRLAGQVPPGPGSNAPSCSLHRKVLLG